MRPTQHGLRVVARVLIQNDAGELLLCRSRKGSSWVPPGGTLDPGETLPDAAAREAEEEVGLEVVVGPLVYVREFRPPNRNEHIIEVVFRATSRTDHPVAEKAKDRRLASIGGPKRRWEAWWIQDVDGPRREVRWFTAEQLASLREPVYPAVLRDRFWQEQIPALDPYLGMDQG